MKKSFLTTIVITAIFLSLSLTAFAGGSGGPQKEPCPPGASCDGTYTLKGNMGSLAPAQIITTATPNAIPSFGWYSAVTGKYPSISPYESNKFENTVVTMKVTPTKKLDRYEIGKKNFRGNIENAYETREGIYLCDVKGKVKLRSSYFIKGYITKAIKENDYKFAIFAFESRLLHKYGGGFVITEAKEIKKGDIGSKVVVRAIPIRELNYDEVGYWFGADKRWITYETSEKGIFFAFRPGQDVIKSKLDGKEIELQGKLRMEERGIGKYFFILVE